MNRDLKVASKLSACNLPYKNIIFLCVGRVIHQTSLGCCQFQPA